MRTLKTLTTVLTLCMLTSGVLAADELAKNFASPPPSARPWVYWFPLDGNLSREGITADLEAMARVGIGGVLYMETDQGAPQGPARFGGPLWREMFKHICNEAHRLGLQVNMNNDAGWCGSGGPWITPELSMQRIVWSETNVVGAQHFEGVLPQPKANKDYYGDIAVFAYPTPATNYVIPYISGKSAATRDEIPLRATYPKVAADAVVPRERIVNLTARLGKDGHFTWEVPAGQWTLLRMGHTTTGKDNHPAPLEGRGLESDKLSKEATEIHFNGLMGGLIADNRPLVGEKRALVSTHIDSWETGSQNWTPKFREEFQRLRGYDPLPWLPVIRGRVVDNIEVSERFLWDVRRTVHELLCENYAGYFRELAHRRGIRLSIEAYDGSPTDDMAYAGRADEPMAEFWSWPKFGAAYSCTEMSSAAHVWGRPILGAEAFTAMNTEKWLGHPAVIKDLGDWAFCEGINRFVFHRYALQPWTNPNRPPGMSMGPWGLHYERTQTWWDMSRAWHEYLARCQYLLQQGTFIADLCFLTPENSPQRFTTPIKSGTSSFEVVPARQTERPGYNFDGCPAEALLKLMKVKNGRLVLPGGMSYRMLVLPQVEMMTPPLLRKVRDLVNGGATVLGNPPVKSPSLQDYPQCDDEVKVLARELWGDGEPPFELTERRLGKGCVIWGRELGKAQKAALEESGTLVGAKWIWFPEGHPERSAPPGTRYFSRVVNVDGEVAWARLLMTADNTFECWVNGQRAGGGQSFKHAYAMSVGPMLKPGANIIAVAAVNTTDTPNPAGFIAALHIRYRNGRTETLVSDAAWKTSMTADGDWKTAASAMQSWRAALQLGPLGMGPWGELEEGPESTDTTLDIAIPSRLLAKMGVAPDFACTTGNPTNSLRYIHHVIGATDVYFVANKSQEPDDAVCTFRVSGKQPELWWPDTGRVQPAAVWSEVGGCTRVPIRFDPSGSVFVVFRQPSGAKLQVANAKNWDEFKPLQEIAGAWQVSFDPKWGGPATPVTFDNLDDWCKRSEPGIRYYSGTAVYRKSFSIPQSAFHNPQSKVFLDLGRVAVMAQVCLNGRDLGILWKPPFRVDVTGALKAGENTLELHVVNLWINRQIGDEQLPEDSDRNKNGTLKSWPTWLAEGKPSPTGRYTFTSWRLWKKDDPLAESGLLGPVTLSVATDAGMK